MSKKAKKSGASMRPSILAFARCVEVSDGLMFSTSWRHRHDPLVPKEPVPVQEKTVRGTMSHYVAVAEGADATKMEARLADANIQSVDFARLPDHHDTLLLEFTVRLVPSIGVPASCGSATYAGLLAQWMEAYRQQHDFKHQAAGLAANLANGRALWRNRSTAEQAEVMVEQFAGGEVKAAWRFRALDHDTKTLVAPADEADQVASLAGVINDGLAGRAPVLLRVRMCAQVGQGIEVFPSQEFVQPEKNVKAKKSKVLYRVQHRGQMVAGMHSQKIGNALRTYDIWHPEVATRGAIPLEPYGAITTEGRVYRATDNFYELIDTALDRLGNKGDELFETEDNPADAHFIVGVLIRGGVFSGDAKDAKE